MKREIIITDLTRFKSGNPKLCTAGIDPRDGTCVRPMPYLRFDECAQHNVLPGTKVQSDFTPSPGRRAPHVEDCDYTPLYVTGKATTDELREVLRKSLSPTIEQGFKCNLPGGAKVIPPNHPVKRSIITIEIEPRNLQVIEDKWGKLKAHITDASGLKYSYISITDLGFFDYAASAKQDEKKIMRINDSIHSQKEVLLRIGLSRSYRAPDGREGHWIQLNGIYTFPKSVPGIRVYR